MCRNVACGSNGPAFVLGDRHQVRHELRSLQQSGKSNLGKQLFDGVCAKCHGLSAEGDIGPKLVGNPLLNDRQGLETVVREGRGSLSALGL